MLGENMFSDFEFDCVFLIGNENITGHLKYNINGIFDFNNQSFQNGANRWSFLHAIGLKLDCDKIINKHFFGAVKDQTNLKVSIFYPHSHMSGPESIEDALNELPTKNFTDCTSELMIIGNDKHYSYLDSYSNPVFDDVMLEFKNMFNVPYGKDFLIANDCPKLRFVNNSIGSISSTCLHMKFIEPVGFQLLRKFISKFQDFFTVVCGRPKYISKIFSMHDNNPYFLMYRQIRFDEYEYNRIDANLGFDTMIILENFDQIVDSWFIKNISNQYFVDFFLMAQYFNMYTPIKYLYFLESLNCYFNKKEFNNTSEYMTDFMQKRFYKESEGLGTRIEYLFTKFIIEMKIKNFISHEFIKKIKNTRDYMAHAGAFTDQDKETFKPQYLFLINDLLLLVNSYCIFKELELENDVIKKWMQNKLELTIGQLSHCDIISKQ